MMIVMMKISGSLVDSPVEQASSTLVSCSSLSTLGAHPLSFSPLPSSRISPSSPHQSPVLAFLHIPFPLLPSLSAPIVSLNSLVLQLRQVHERLREERT